jgi:hypothetical protein
MISLIGRAKEIFNDCLNLLISKNKDYSATDPEGFGNFRKLGDKNVEMGIITRLSDKFARIESYVANGSLHNESFEDTLKDIINYSVILLAWRERNEEQDK